jgi:enoyl-CoA hydratase
VTFEEDPMADAAQLRIDVEDAIAVFTLDCPAQRNAATPEIMVRLSAAWREYRERGDWRVAIVTGAGDQAFCAGGDLKRSIPLLGGALQPQDDWERRLLADRRCSTDWALFDFELDKPVICALNGDALGGGCELMLACDLRVAAAGIRIGLVEPRRGLVPGGGGVQRLPRQIPRAVALELLLTAEPISAERALELGMLNRVVAREKLLDEALGLARRVAANGPLALQAIKRTLRATEVLPIDQALREGGALLQPVFSSEDAEEGRRAFFEKRAPVWRGR